MKKKIVALKAFLLIVAVLFVSVSSAHNRSQSGYVPVYGGEYVGWDINDYAHTNGSNVYYKYNTSDPYFSSTNSPNYKRFMEDGAALWNRNVANINVSYSSSARGAVTTYTKNNDLNAKFEPGAGAIHEKNWVISMNRVGNPTAVTMAHEFGHAIGLLDLEAPAHKNKLMYYADTRTVSYPQPSDRNGAYVITGYINHFNGQMQIYDTFAGKELINGKKRHWHIDTCLCCNGQVNNGAWSYCVYNSAGKCVSCRTPRNGDVNGDGRIDSADSDIIGRIVANTFTPNLQQFICADINGDGEVNITDLLELLKYLAQLDSMV